MVQFLKVKRKIFSDLKSNKYARPQTKENL